MYMCMRVFLMVSELFHKHNMGWLEATGKDESKPNALYCIHFASLRNVYITLCY